MLILGVDPGVIFTGYGIIDADGKEVRVVDYGILEFGREFELPDRLDSVYRGITRICTSSRPDALALEDVFFNKNARTALTVGHVRGAVILAALHHGLDVFTYTPLQIKQTVTGYGRANKAQVQRMVQISLKLKVLPQPDHAADALAAALCHYFSDRPLRGAKEGKEQ
ncbi:MAG TPA: crossover junction endodeoxyribonuclease RuvC [Syntrophomonadaceae bacterium]|nr:crossover junction endodeoxyribonuclease RuvC [Syntrophomonadaceae bacterium]